MMKKFVIFLAFLAALNIEIITATEKADNKLKIGIKKRVIKDKVFSKFNTNFA